MALINVVIDTNQKSILVAVDGNPMGGVSNFSCSRYEYGDGVSMGCSFSQNVTEGDMTKCVSYYFRPPMEESEEESDSAEAFVKTTEGAKANIVHVIPVF